MQVPSEDNKSYNKHQSNIITEGNMQIPCGDLLTTETPPLSKTCEQQSTMKSLRAMKSDQYTWSPIVYEYLFSKDCYLAKNQTPRGDFKFLKLIQLSYCHI